MYLWKGIVALLKIILRYSRFIPAGLSGFFVVITFFIDIFKYGFSYATAHLAKILLATELIINENVQLAIQNDQSYTLSSFFAIVSSVIILFIFIKFLTKLFIKIAGAQAEWGAIALSVAFVFIIEIITVRATTGFWGFVPIKDGLWFLLTNIGSVLTNIHYF